MIRSDPELRRLILWPLLVVAAVISLVICASTLYRTELEVLGRGLLARFGNGGLLVGTFMADAFHVPIPPQFYLFVTVTSRCPQPPALALISLGSLLGGTCAYCVGRGLSHLPRARRLFASAEERIEHLFARYGIWAVVLGSIGPIPFSTLCNTAGFYRMPARAFALFVALRVPRLLFFYAIIRLGWG
jgi:membrane protein YqaA with SNARE-associated domain